MPMGIVFWLLVSAIGEADALNRYVCRVPGEGQRGCMWPGVKCLQRLPDGCGMDPVLQTALQQIVFFFHTEVL